MSSSKLPTPTSCATRWLPCGHLGSGSFGHVSLALNLVDHTLFAIKSCPASCPSSPLLLSLLNEFQILQSLRSPFILHCLGAHFDDSPAASPILRSLFLEYMDGGSLADLLHRSGGKLSDEILVARYTRAILQGLDYLHQNGVVHCDIKSHNILIGSSGVKIADFGAARRIGDSSVMGGMLRGTPLYMAPEVVEGVEQGPPSDIWSLGCTVVEMLQGRPPWAHINNVAALFLKLGNSGEKPPLPELISKEAKDFLQLCLQRDPKARPTAGELLQHPFVCLGGKLGERAENMSNDSKLFCKEAVSPRSTLKFLQTAEWRDGCCTSSVSNVVEIRASTTSARTGSPVCSKCTSEDARGAGQWITVKRRTGGGWREDRQGLTPFDILRAESRAALQSNINIRKGSEISLDCASFLKNRRRRTVG